MYNFSHVVKFNVQEVGTEGEKAQLHFEEIVKSNIAIYVVSYFLWL